MFIMQRRLGAAYSHQLILRLNAKAIAKGVCGTPPSAYHRQNISSSRSLTSPSSTQQLPFGFSGSIIFNQQKMPICTSSACSSNLKEKTAITAARILPVAGRDHASTVKGLPRLYCHREKKLAALLNTLENKSAITLVTAPPQSRKTAMASLFQEYIKRERPQFDVIFIDFGDFDEANKTLEVYLKSKYGIELKGFRKKYTNNPNCLFILDEVQRIYHCPNFWNRFKSFGRTRCSLVAFSAFILPALGNNLPCSSLTADPGTMPALLRENVLSYSFIAFDSDEFENVRQQFEDKYGDRFKKSSEKINFIKDSVSLHQLDQGDKKVEAYHPGLTYICLMAMTESEPRVIPALDQSTVLYQQVLRQMNCFPKLNNLDKLFGAIYNQHVHDRLDSKFLNSEAISRFSTRFENLMNSLIKNGFFLLNNYSMESDSYIELFVRYALCCAEIKEDAFKISLSCPIMRVHFISELVKWRKYSPPTIDSKTEL